jgi:hypothetical protein
MDDYLIDGIEKQVPLLPATTDIGTIDELTSSPQELVSPPEIPRRPVPRESLESHGEQGTADDIPVIPKRPVRKPSMEGVEEPGLRRQVSQRSQPSVDDEPLVRQSSIKSGKSHAEIEIGEYSQTPSAEEPFIPPRPTRKSNSKNIPERDMESEMEPIIPPRPMRVSSIKGIPEIEPGSEVEPTVPPRPTRVSSIKSIQDTSAERSEAEKESEPFIPPRSTRKSTTKSIPDTTAEPPEVETESEPFIPPRPTRKSSIKSIPEITTPEPAPIIPQRATRKSSVKSFKSQNSIEEESSPAVDVDQPMEPSVDIPAIPHRPRKVELKSAELEESMLPIEKAPTSPHQHPIIPARPKKHEPTESVVMETGISKPEEDSVQDVPVIPRRPKVSEEPALRTAGLAALMATPAIPRRPAKSKADPTLPKVTLDQTPEIAQTGSGIYESAEESNHSKTSTQIETEDSLNIKHATPKEVPGTSIPKEATTPASEIQSGVISAKSRVKSPPIPARPQHKLAKQFEQIMVKEKPAPPPRPVKPVVGTSSRFAGLRAQFAKDLNERLAKPPPPVQKKDDEEVHSMEEKREVVQQEKKDVVGEKVGDVRKGRARGPQRRPPTVKPIIPAGWGVSVISTVFEQAVGGASGNVEKELSVEGELQEPYIENQGQIESSGMSEKSEGQTQMGERIIESEGGVKAVLLEGDVIPGDNRVEQEAEPMKVEEDESDGGKGVDLSESMGAEEIVPEVQHEKRSAMVENPEREEF